MREQSYALWDCSDGTHSAEGLWAKGPPPDGRGQFECLAQPKPLTTDTPELGTVDPQLHGTPKAPLPAAG